MLGHNSSKTTEIYTHVIERNIVAIRSRWDEIIGKGRAEGGESDRVELANPGSDISSPRKDFRTTVRR